MTRPFSIEEDYVRPFDWRCCITMAIVLVICALLIGIAWGHVSEEPAIPDTPEPNEETRSMLFNENADGSISYIAFTKEGDLHICVRGVLYQSITAKHDLILRRVWQGEAVYE